MGAMTRYGAVLLACAALLPACQKTTEPTVAPTAQVRPPAKPGLSEQERTMAVKRLYQLGEDYFEVGDYPGAVALWRQVFLLLPADEAGDRLRHQLVARMAYGLMLAFEQTGQPAHLDQAEQFLERWVAKHEALFPTGPAREAERAQMYELIGQIAILRDRGAGEPDRLGPTQSEATIVGEFETLERAQADDHAGEEVGPDGIKREIVVPKNNRLASISDPRVRRWLSHPSPLGPSLMEGGDEPYSPTRPLVRAGVSKLATKGASARDERLARRQLRQVVRVARPRLEQCYAEALTRAPVLVSKLEVEVTIDEEGRVTQSKIEDGRLIDAVGDACVMWALMGAEPLPDTALASRVTLAMPVTFFIQNEARITPSMMPGPSGPSPANPGDTMLEYGADRQTKGDRGADVGEPQK
jgi:hypothetical protein